MAQTAQRDSRDGSVELDYDNLIVRGPSTFLGQVTFSNFINGITWPRAYKFTANAYNYVAPGSAQLPLNTQVVVYNDFNTAPTNSHTNYFTVSDPGGTITNVAAGTHYMSIVCRLTIPGLGLNVLGSFQMQLMRDPAGAPPLEILDQQFHTVTSVTAPFANEFTLRAIDLPSQQNDTYFIQITASVNFTVNPEVTIIINK